jgi:carbohydrate-binding DOMON domain-containing protein
MPNQTTFILTFTATICKAHHATKQSADFTAYRSTQWSAISTTVGIPYRTTNFTTNGATKSTAYSTTFLTTKQTTLNSTNKTTNETTHISTHISTIENA